jgi:sphingolipid delta-4 desaturase
VLPRHESWPLVTLQFILGSESGLWARIKRKGKGAGGWDGQQPLKHQQPAQAQLAETKKVQ